MMQSISPMIRVDDYPRAKAFYTDSLGFACVEEAGDPVVGFGIFVRDKIRVFLHAWDGAAEPYKNWRAWIYVADMDAFLEELSQSGVTPSKAHHVTPYDMREVEVTDPDGNVLCFGSDI